MPVTVTDYIAPTSPSDTYPTHDSIYGLGGHREVATIILRNAISAQRRRVGMTVYVAETDTIYRLQNAGVWSVSDSSGKVDRTGDQMTGNLAFHNEDVTGGATVTIDFDAGNFLTLPAPTGDFEIVFDNLPTDVDNVKVVSVRIKPATNPYTITLDPTMKFMCPVAAPIPANKMATFSFTAWGPDITDILVAYVGEL